MANAPPFDVGSQYSKTLNNLQCKPRSYRSGNNPNKINPKSMMRTNEINPRMSLF